MPLHIDELREIVCFNARFGLQYSELGENERFVVDQSIRSGYSRYVSPSDQPSNTTGALPYEWNFLRPILAITTIANQWQYDAPVGVYRIMDRLYDTSASMRSDVSIMGIGNILSARAKTQTPGRPAIVSFDLKSSGNGTEPPSWMFSFYPIPDGEYTYAYKALIDPPVPSNTLPICIGDPVCREALIECCLAAYESRFGDKSGIHEALAQRELLRAISADKSRPVQEYGYSGGSVIEYDYARWGSVGTWHRISGLVTYDPALRYTG